MVLIRLARTALVVSFVFVGACVGEIAEEADEIDPVGRKVCGDGACDRRESCASCAVDCGVCPEEEPPPEPPPPPDSSNAPAILASYVIKPNSHYTEARYTPRGFGK